MAWSSWGRNGSDLELGTGRNRHSSARRGVVSPGRIYSSLSGSRGCRLHAVQRKIEALGEAAVGEVDPLVIPESSLVESCPRTRVVRCSPMPRLPGVRQRGLRVRDDRPHRPVPVLHRGRGATDAVVVVIARPQ